MSARAARGAGPVARSETARRAILQCLEREGPRTARQLAGQLALRERDVEGHLEHLQRTLRRAGRPLQIEPARCASCDYRFAQRARLSRPGSCPRCRGRRIAAPSFHVGPAR